jgi:hypothetical protein
MNTRTGQIIGAASAEELLKAIETKGWNPDDVVPIGQPPSKSCPICKGRGHDGRMVLIEGVYRYRPCQCTVQGPVPKPGGKDLPIDDEIMRAQVRQESRDDSMVRPERVRMKGNR